MGTEHLQNAKVCILPITLKIDPAAPEFAQRVYRQAIDYVQNYTQKNLGIRFFAEVEHRAMVDLLWISEPQPDYEGLCGVAWSYPSPVQMRGFSCSMPLRVDIGMSCAHYTEAELIVVAIHELGHILALDHNREDLKSFLWPQIRRGPIDHQFTQRDLDALLLRYGQGKRRNHATKKAEVCNQPNAD